MLRVSSSTVTFPDGQVLKRQKVVVSQTGDITIKTMRTNEINFSSSGATVTRVGRNNWSVFTAEGTLNIKRAGCNCGG